MQADYLFLIFFVISFFMSAEIQKYISEISNSFSLISRRIQFETLKDRISSKTLECENPDIWKDQSLAKGLMRERQDLIEKFETFTKLTNEFDDIKTLYEIGAKEKDEVLLIELESSFSKLKVEAAEMQVLSLLDGEADSNDSFLEINSGAGGTESCDWAQMLARMYYRWAEKKKYKIELISESPGDEAGIKSCCYKISGNNAYGWLKAESGVHRLVRISPFDSSSRRHTSFSSVWVYPVVDDNFDIEISPSELRVDTIRSSGPGGQHANKTDSAVRITHLPTGIVVTSSEKSQHQNRANCMTALKSRLYDLEMRKRNESIQESHNQKGEAGWGNQIRSYVLHPYQMVKDLRSGKESSDSQKVLDGNLDAFMSSVLSLTSSK